MSVKSRLVTDFLSSIYIHMYIHMHMDLWITLYYKKTCFILDTQYRYSKSFV